METMDKAEIPRGWRDRHRCGNYVMLAVAVHMERTMVMVVAALGQWKQHQYHGYRYGSSGAATMMVAMAAVWCSNNRNVSGMEKMVVAAVDQIWRWWWRHKAMET